MDKKSPLDPPESSAGDTAHLAGRTLLSLIPYLGGPAVELFSALVAPPLERRRQEWMEAIATALNELHESDRINIDDLREDDQFVDVLLSASQSAIRTSQDEKLEALRNAVLNSALPNPPDESLIHIFLALVDEFTEWHLRILKLFQNPVAWAEANDHKFPSTNSLSGILEDAFPELKGQRSFYDLIWSTLASRGLVGGSGLHGMMTSAGTLEARTTAIGNQFLRFIEDPDSSA